MSSPSKNLAWIDLEMTGLDCENDLIIEIATIVTDSELNIVAEGPSIAIYQPDSVLEKMGSWCKKQHSSSGLIERVRASACNCAEAETLTLDFLERYVAAGTSPMCGNSICQDRRFLARLMPKLESFFHYRHIDVSTIKELAKRWRPDLKLENQSQHLALSDIRDSISELIYYRTRMIKD